MAIEIIIPSVGESVTEAFIDSWSKNDGDAVSKGELILVIETEKVALEIEAAADGILKIAVANGESVAIGAVVGHIETDGTAAAAQPVAATPEPVPVPVAATPTPTPATPSTPAPIAAAAPSPEEHPLYGQLTPSQRRELRELEIQIDSIPASRKDGQLTVADILMQIEKRQHPDQYVSTPVAPVPATAPAEATAPTQEIVTRSKISPMRRKIAERLLEAKRNTAMLTTFNEVDMSRVMAIRSQYKEAFKEKHNINLGFMSFFLKAVITAMESCPDLNASMTEQEIIRPSSIHMGVAIGSSRGLVVPVIRQAEKLSFAGLEQAIVDYVVKIKNNQLNLSDMEGGTFTVTNGGIYGSLMSTPILNPPQSGILGMHAIKKRPIVVDDQIVIRPMMNLALSYDHRIIDGKEAVTFLVRIKESIEDPERMLLDI
ncbi:MAG: 2-oxoglutarate dehydrogenase complex dihydrolipoyllysine-residue succinyltransferase [Magnetococcales bacterium]|nr:2-oxoglutarate dehydrogenase complex dihydrolipoyllysine-residue succinyltransferase [Magnetococcales bacterium]